MEKHGLYSRSRSCPPKAGSCDGWSTTGPLKCQSLLRSIEALDDDKQNSISSVQRTHSMDRKAESRFITPENVVLVSTINAAVPEQDSQKPMNPFYLAKSPTQLLSPPRTSPVVDVTTPIRRSERESSLTPPSSGFSAPATPRSATSFFREVIVIGDDNDHVQTLLEYIEGESEITETKGCHFSNQLNYASPKLDGYSRQLVREGARVKTSIAAFSPLISDPIPHNSMKEVHPVLEVTPAVSREPVPDSVTLPSRCKPIDSQVDIEFQDQDENTDIGQCSTRLLRPRKSHIEYREPRTQNRNPIRIPLAIPTLSPNDVILDSIETEPPTEDEYEVERIVGGGVRIDTGQVVYMIKWVGYEELTLEPAECCLHCPEKIAEWMAIPRANDLVEQFVEQEVRERRKLAGAERQKKKERMRNAKGKFTSPGNAAVSNREKPKSPKHTDIEDSHVQGPVIQAQSQNVQQNTQPEPQPVKESPRPRPPPILPPLKKVAPKNPPSEPQLPENPRPKPPPILPPPKKVLANTQLFQPILPEKRDLASLLRQEKCALQPAGSKTNRLRQEFQGTEDIHPKRVRVISGDGRTVAWANRCQDDVEN